MQANNLMHTAFGQFYLKSAYPWSTLVEGGKEQYRPPGKITLELVHANQSKINFYVYGLFSLPSGPVRFLTSFYLSAPWHTLLLPVCTYYSRNEFFFTK